jgi:hypothetical protein
MNRQQTGVRIHQLAGLRVFETSPERRGAGPLLGIVTRPRSGYCASRRAMAPGVRSCFPGHGCSILLPRGTYVGRRVSFSASSMPCIQGACRRCRPVRCAGGGPTPICPSDVVTNVRPCKKWATQSASRAVASRVSGGLFLLWSLERKCTLQSSNDSALCPGHRLHK